MKGYFTTSELAAKLGISAARVRQLIAEGTIKKVEKIGRDNFIPEREAKRLVAMDRKPGRPAKKEGK